MGGALIDVRGDAWSLKALEAVLLRFKNRALKPVWRCSRCTREGPLV